MILGSEAGLLAVAPADIKRLGRLQPGKLFLVDLERGRIVEDRRSSTRSRRAAPYGDWFDEQHRSLRRARPSAQVTISDQPLRRRQRAFGYTHEDIRVLLPTMVRDGQEPVGSMGADISLAVALGRGAGPVHLLQAALRPGHQPADRPDPRGDRDEHRQTGLGSEGNLLAETREHAHQLVLDRPILRNHELETLRHVSHDLFAPSTIDITWSIADGAEGLEPALDRVCTEAHEAIAEGVNIIILSDRLVGPRRVPIPSLLAVAAVHHHLVREGTRLRVGLVIETGEAREVHHIATLIGYGASVVNP